MSCLPSLTIGNFLIYKKLSCIHVHFKHLCDLLMCTFPYVRLARAWQTRTRAKSFMYIIKLWPAAVARSAASKKKNAAAVPRTLHLNKQLNNDQTIAKKIIVLNFIVNLLLNYFVYKFSKIKLEWMLSDYKIREWLYNYN